MNFQKDLDAALKFKAENPTWVLSGFVLVDTDTANMRIFADGKERVLITPERNELMEPTLPCFQVSFAEFLKNLNKKDPK